MSQEAVCDGRNVDGTLLLLGGVLWQNHLRRDQEVYGAAAEKPMLQQVDVERGRRISGNLVLYCLLDVHGQWWRRRRREERIGSGVFRAVFMTLA